MHADNQLIRKIKKNGDRKAADELVSRYYREVYAFAYRQTSDMDLAMDLTQEIFIAALKGIPSFDEKKAGFRTWLYSIASNKITDYYRSRYHRQLESEVYGEQLEMIGDSYIKVDTDAWEKESEETGTMEFEVEAMGGVPRKYLVTVEAYKPNFSFTYTWIPAE